MLRINDLLTNGIKTRMIRTDITIAISRLHYRAFPAADENSTRDLGIFALIKIQVRQLDFIALKINKLPLILICDTSVL